MIDLIIVGLIVLLICLLSVALITMILDCKEYLQKIIWSCIIIAFAALCAAGVIGEYRSSNALDAMHKEAINKEAAWLSETERQIEINDSLLTEIERGIDSLIKNNEGK